MSTAKVDAITNRAGTGAPTLTYGLNSPGFGFLAQKTASNQAISNSTSTLVTFTYERSDPSSVYSSNRFTVPAGGTGLYLVCASAAWAANATGIRQLNVILNGTDDATHKWSNAQTGSSAGATTTAVVVPLFLTAGDYLECYADQNSGGSLDINGNENQTFFGVARL